ncbi:flagellar hook-length control protein FliK [Dyella humicola]|uniref:flagellar hook-length control protein FliK n=1 Tax=Dyella humicola TaxID=2992126 RepID=UPI002258B0CC|nr:flagellar hook-length control protein FliK [Dyella humicola]
MTPAIAVNVTPPSAACGPASAANSSSDGHSPSAFSTPLQQARQQQSAQRSSTSAPTASTTTTSTATSSTTASTASSTVTGKSWNPKGDDAKDDDKPTTRSGPNPPTDAAAAMLALLGQSIPANAAPSPAAPAAASSESATATGTALAATAMQVSGMSGMSMSGAALASAQPDADDAGNASKATDGLQDNALAALLGDADDDTTPSTATGNGVDAKVVNASQATATTSTPSDKSDPLDALRNLTTPFGQTQASVQAAPTPHAMTMNASAGTPSFAQELGQHVAWLGGQNIKEARITLHPEDLGQLDVKVSVQHDHVDVSFIAQHPNAVHAVQQTLSQLDSMLAQHGLTLGQAQVGQGNQGGGAGQGASSGSAAAGDAGATDEGDVAQVAAPVVQALGLLDTFA